MAQKGDTPQTDEGGVDWVRLADGVFLTGLGVFAYLNATGRLPWTFWFDALTLWPIMLVTAGLRIAFNHTRRAWLIVLGPLTVLGLLAGMASGRLSGAPGTWQPVSEARGPRRRASCCRGRSDLVTHGPRREAAAGGRRRRRAAAARARTRRGVERRTGRLADTVVLLTATTASPRRCPGG